MISIDRAKAIVLCYGGSPASWPEPDREAILQLLPDSKSLTDLQAEALVLDDFMGFSGHNEETINSELDRQCMAKILARLPEQSRKIDQVPAIFIESGLNRIQKISKPTVLVASLALVALGLSSNLQPNTLKDEAEQLSISEYMTLYVDDASILVEETATDEQLEIFAFLEPQIMDDYI